MTPNPFFPSRPAQSGSPTASRRRRARRAAVALVWLAAACSPGSTGRVDGAPSDDSGTSAGDGGGSPDGGGAGADAGSPVDGSFQPDLPVCVWNQAYQENYQADSVADILADAAGCYVLVDPFESTAARDAIPAINAADNVVGCYISTGTCEDWRDDFAAMQPYCVSEPWGEWPGEYFVDMPEPGLIDVMEARIDKMAGWGCDMVEFDNMDWAFDDANREEYGITATAEDAIAYHQALCDYVHGKGMGCMAKNTRQGAEGFDGGTFESYSDDLDWWEHDHLAGFLAQQQIAFIVHYDETDCDGVYADYQQSYGDRLSFLCEDRATERYRHYNP